MTVTSQLTASPWPPSDEIVDHTFSQIVMIVIVIEYHNCIFLPGNIERTINISLVAKFSTSRFEGVLNAGVLLKTRSTQ